MGTLWEYDHALKSYHTNKKNYWYAQKSTILKSTIYIQKQILIFAQKSNTNPYNLSLN